MKRVVHAVAAAVLVTAAGTSSALAADSGQPYWPTGRDGVETSSETVRPGESVTVTFAGFKPLSTVTIVLSQVSGGAEMTSSLGPIALVSATSRSFTERADREGVVTVEVTLPESGSYEVEAQGVDGEGRPRVVSTEVLATAVPAGSSAAGAEAGEQGGIGLGGIGLGAVLGGGAVLALAGAGIAARRRVAQVD